jgi:ATP-dependent protease HslVU (ClpYQ) peptidase subunit
MTIIACDGKTAAADSQVSVGDQKFVSTAYKLERQGGHLFGFFGSESGHQQLIDWYLNHSADPSKLSPAFNENDWGMVVFFQEHAVVYQKNCLFGDVYAYPCAFGSGDHFAIGAMSAGASAYNAAKIACKHSTTCGLPVITRTLKNAAPKWTPPSKSTIKSDVSD